MWYIFVLSIYIQHLLKSFFSIPLTSTMQSDLQLAKALSLSLKDSESPSQLTIVPTNTEDVSIGILQAPAEFQNPGRPPPKKKKRLASTTLLLLRTEEERNKIIQDKVDAIVALSHKCETDLEKIEQLQSITEEQKTTHLWNLSSTVAEKSSYYVDQLLDWIKPSDIEVGSKLCNLSQIPGHRIFTQLPCDYTFSCADKSIVSDVMMESNPPSSLASSLRSLIGNSWMSDVDIHTASGIVIPAHKIFLALRCPSLKNAFDEPIECGKYILNWENTSFDAALHFLNFIYTGSTEWKEEVIDELTQLAKKYEVNDLLTILNDSKTLELLIGEDSDVESSVVLPPMDSNFCFKDSGVADCSTLKEDRNNKMKTPHYEQVNSSFIDENLKEDKNIEKSTFSAIGSGFQSNCNFTEMESSYHSPCNTTPLSSFDKVVLNISKDNIKIIKMNSFPPHLETCITDSNSSDDSCTVLQSMASCDSSVTEHKMSPIPSFKTCETSGLHQHTPSTSKHDLVKSDILPDSPFQSLSENSSKDNGNFYKENSTSSRLGPNIVLDDNSNDDIFIVKEFADKSDSTDERNSVSDNMLILESGYGSSQKLSSFSSVFQNEYEDLDAAICLSQNTSFQDQNVSRIRNWGCELSSVSFQTNSYDSPGKLSSDGHCSKQKFSFTKSYSFHNEVSNSNAADEVFVDNECEILSSPEILVCDSDDENLECSGRNSFKTYESLSQKMISPPKNKLRTNFQNEVTEKETAACERPHCDSVTSHNDETHLKSPNERKIEVFDQSFLNGRESASGNGIVSSETTISNSLNLSPKNLEDIVPELIYCDSNSDDKMEPIKFSQSLDISSKCIKNNENDCISILSNYESTEQLKRSPCRNVLSSPDSPWTFRTDKSSEDIEVPKKEIKSFKSSAMSSQLNSDITGRKFPKNNALEDIKTTNSAITTPKDLIKYKFSDSPITPLPDYRNMVTPEIKEALKKIGVKALPRKKAIAVLSHVYDEIHPWNDGATGSNVEDLKSASQLKSKSLSQKKTLSLPKKRKETTEICEREAKKKENKCSSADQYPNKVLDKAIKKTAKVSGSLLHKRKDDKGTHNTNSSPESVKNSSFGSSNSREGEAHNLSISSEFSDSGLPDCKDSTEHIKKYILSNNELYTKILNYTPVNLAEFQQELKDNEIKISIKQLTDYLDEQCITFTYPRKEEYKKKQQVRTQRFRKRMIAKLSQKGSSNLS